MLTTEKVGFEPANEVLETTTLPLSYFSHNNLNLNKL